MKEIKRTVGKGDIIITPKNLEAIGVKMGQHISIRKFHASITPKQLRFVHAYFQFCIEAGGEAVGHYDAHSFWTDAKGWLKATHPIKEFERITLSDMTQPELEKILRIIDLEYIQEKIGIDTLQFWCDYQKFKDSGTEMEYDEWAASQ